MAEQKEKSPLLLTPVFRVSFPQVFEPAAYGGGKPKCSVVAIWSKKQEGKELERMKAIIKLAEKTAIAKFGEESFRKMRKLGKFKWPIRDGEEKDLDGYGADKVFATLSTKGLPGVIGRNKERLDETTFYAGCHARATVTCYAFDNEGKGVAFGLNNVQKVGEGEAFSQRTSADDDFDEVDDSVWVDDYAVDMGAKEGVEDEDLFT